MSLKRKEFYKNLLKSKYTDSMSYCCSIRQATTEMKDSLRVFECKTDVPCRYCEWQKTSGIWACSLDE